MRQSTWRRRRVTTPRIFFRKAVRNVLGEMPERIWNLEKKWWYGDWVNGLTCCLTVETVTTTWVLRTNEALMGFWIRSCHLFQVRVWGYLCRRRHLVVSLDDPPPVDSESGSCGNHNLRSIRILCMSRSASAAFQAYMLFVCVGGFFTGFSWNSSRIQPLGLRRNMSFSRVTAMTLPKSSLSYHGWLNCKISTAIDAQGFEDVDRYTCRTPHFHMYRHSTDHTAQMTCAHGSSGSSLSCVLKTGQSSARHVSLCASQYTEHEHKFSFTYLSCVTVIPDPRPDVHVSINPPRRSTAGRYFCGIPLLHRLRAQKGSSSTGIWSTHEIKQLTTRMIWRKLVSNSRPTANHWHIQPTIRQKALWRRLTRTSKTSKYVRCWLYTGTGGKWRTSISLSLWTRKLDDKFFSRSRIFRETWCSVFHATVNRVKSLFPKETEVMSRETVSRVVFILFLDLLTRQMLGNHFLMETRIICLIKVRSELMKREHQVESLDSCVEELQQQAYAQRLELEDAHHGHVESRREQSRLQEESSMKEKPLRETQIRNIHEIGEMKRAQELRVDEFSVQKFRESHETIQRLTSQMQEMQEQMNPMHDSVEEVESNYSGKFSHVPSQPAAILNSRSMLSRDKRLPLDTWNTSEPQENVINFLQLIRPEIIIEEFITLRHQVLRDRFQCMLVQARRPSTMSSLFPMDIQQNSMVGQQRQQISQLHFDKFPTLSTLLYWKIRFKN